MPLLSCSVFFCNMYNKTRTGARRSMLFWHGNNHCYNRNIISPGFIRMEALCWWIIVTEYRAFEVQKRTVHLRNVRSRPSPQIFILFFLVLYHVNLFGSDRSTTQPDQNLLRKKKCKKQEEEFWHEIVF